jgi:hypothetical protein
MRPARMSFGRREGSCAKGNVQKAYLNYLITETGVNELTRAVFIATSPHFDMLSAALAYLCPERENNKTKIF